MGAIIGKIGQPNGIRKDLHFMTDEGTKHKEIQYHFNTFRMRS